MVGLSGAALTSASLAFIGGGSLAVGGMGMAGGIAILTGGGADRACGIWRDHGRNRYSAIIGIFRAKRVRKTPYVLLRDSR